MAAPPLEAEAVQDTTDWVLALDVAATAVGTLGVVAGVAADEGADAPLVPAELVAFTVNVYGVPLVRPDTVQLVVAAEQEKPPGDDVAV